MSVHVMSWVFKNSETEGNDRLCLLVLANYADEEGMAWPGLARIAHEMRVSVRTAQRCLRSLTDSGHLGMELNAAPDNRLRGGRKTNAYRIKVTTPVARPSYEWEGGPAQLDPGRRLTFIADAIKKCSYCLETGDDLKGPDGKSWEVDRVVPAKQGGTYIQSNMVLACSFCNKSKKDRGANGGTPSETGGVPTGDSRGANPGSYGVPLLAPKPPIDPSGDPPVLSEAEASLRTRAAFAKQRLENLSAQSIPKAPKAKAPKAPKPQVSAITADTFVVTPEMRAWAATEARGIDVDAQTEQFLDWWRAGGGPRGTGYKNPEAGWRNWMRRSKPGGLAPWKQPDKTNRNPANTYGDEHRVGGGRVIQ